MKKVEAAELPSRKTALVRGKYTNLLRQGTNIAILDPDVVDHFPNSESVNNALRAFLELGKHFGSVVAAQRPPTKSAEGSDHPYEFDPRTGRTAKAFAAK